MMKNNILGFALFLVFILIAIVYYHYSTGKTDELVEQLKKEYPRIKISESVNARITGISHGNPKIFRNNPNHAFVTLNRSLKKRITASYELTKELVLDDVLVEGDQLVKEPGTDKFYIYKIQTNDTLIYVFELRDDLGYPLNTLN